MVKYVKVQREALAESSFVFGRVGVLRCRGRFILRHSNINGTGIIHKVYVHMFTTGHT